MPQAPNSGDVRHMKGIRCLKNVGYRFIPKAACTSIKLELYRLIFDREFDAEKEGRHVHKFFAKGRHKVIDDCKFRFIVVRDPVKRFLSAYSNRVGHHQELSEHFLQGRCPELIESLPRLNPNVDQFIEHFEAYLPVPPIHHHCRPMVEFLEGEKLSYFNHVYELRETDQLAQDLSAHLGKAVSFGRSQTGGTKVSLADLSRPQIDKLFDFYDEDYQVGAKYFTKDALLKEWRDKGGS